ncbi:SH3 domain-containing protein [Oricola sp.]|uniref:SH3 domain-containing protein n=1 Tax=Oricola sp. TaxID=1979950 RepID=UPI0025D71965|nr:SH3 domain-containing protein [Oricola sp.]MCI5077767.1 SH3 domain-containing protein [Oricola sp.]
MPWDEPPPETIWKKASTQIATLALLAVIGGAGGAALAAWALHEPAAPPVVSDVAQTAEPAPEDVPAETASADAPRVIAPLPAAETERFDGGPVANDASEEQDAVLMADAGGDSLPETAQIGLDAASTAAIPVAVAETEAEVAALEEAMAAEGAQGFALPGETAEPAAAAASMDEPAATVAVLPDAPQSPAWTSEHVNLRATPDNEGEIVAVIPADSEILAQEDCTHWCAVTHEGRSGFVYKSFIRR